MSTRCIGEVAELLRGVTYGKNDTTDSTAPDALPLLRATNITETGLVLTDLVFIPARLAKPEQRVQKGDIVITMSSGSASVVGRSVLVDEPIDATFGAFCGVLRASDQVLDRYLSYMIRAPQVRQCWSDVARGTNINNLKREDVLQTAILVPPLVEQQRIVAKLDAIDANLWKLSERLDAELLQSTQLLVSVADELFAGASGTSTALGEVCHLATGGTPSTHNRSFYESGEIKWLRSGDVHMREIRDCEGRITAAGMVSANTKFLPLNSVLIALAGQGKTRGTVAMLRTQATCNQSVVSIMPQDVKFLIPEFVYWYLRSKYDEIRRLTGDDGKDRRGLNMRIIRGLEVPVPPMTEQERIVARLDEMQSVCAKVSANIERRKAKAGELHQSVLAAASRGAL